MTTATQDWQSDSLDLVHTIALGLERGYTAAELLDENSPIRDRIRLVVSGTTTHAAPQAPTLADVARETANVTLGMVPGHAVAQRVVMETEHLVITQMLASEVQRLAAERDRLRAVNAELLAALQRLVDRNLTYLDGAVMGGQITREDVLAARAAIAAATNGQV